MSLDDIINREAARQQFGADKEPGEQGSIEWLMERCGYLTASRMKDAMDFQKSGKEGAKRAMYRKEKVCERITGKPIEHYVSKPMQDGIDREPLAKLAYEARTGAMLRDAGFKKHPTIAWLGGSPDALIDQDGGLEIKSPTPTTHLDTLLNGMSEDHMPQVQTLIWLFDAQWWDFCSYCPDFDEPLRTYIQRIPRDEKYIMQLSAHANMFLREVAEMVASLTDQPVPPASVAPATPDAQANTQAGTAPDSAPQPTSSSSLQEHPAPPAEVAESNSDADIGILVLDAIAEVNQQTSIAGLNVACEDLDERVKQDARFTKAVAARLATFKGKK